MDEGIDALTLALTGQLPFVGIAAPLLALPVSALLLRLYRRAVVAAMRREAAPRGAAGNAGAGGAELARDEQQARGAPPPQGPLDVRVVEPGTPLRLQGPARYLAEAARTRPWRLAAVYAVGGVVFAGVMAGAFLAASGTAFRPLRFATLTWVFAWPVVIATWLVAAIDWPARARVGAVYAVGLVMLGGLALSRSPDLSVRQLGVLYLILNGPPSLLLLAFWNRRVRAVGVLVLVFLAVAITGSLVVLAIVGGSDDLLRNVAGVAVALGLGAGGAMLALVVLGFALFGILGWIPLRAIGKGYRSKRLSDQSLLLDALWLLFALSNSIGLVFEGAPWILSGLVAFVAYRGTVAVGQRWCRAEELPRPGARLLVLRVFALGARSKRLFEAVANRWRQVGSLQLIAGPDLATTTVEPHEFLGFLSGRLASAFISDERVLDHRMADLDLRPDRDGRFRVNEFFCYEDTWQSVLRRLVDETDAVLMDLRGFSPANAGCRLELRALAEQVPLDRVILVVDDGTDTSLLERELRDALALATHTSPNRAPAAVRTTWFRLGRTAGPAISGLVGCLCAAAAAPTGDSRGAATGGRA